jgi:hypothetical protein
MVLVISTSSAVFWPLMVWTNVATAWGEGKSVLSARMARIIARLCIGKLLFCVGAMTIVGSLQRLNGDHTMLLTKSMLIWYPPPVLPLPWLAWCFPLRLCWYFWRLVLLAQLAAPFLSEWSLPRDAAWVLCDIGWGEHLGVTKSKPWIFCPPFSYRFACRFL